MGATVRTPVLIVGGGPIGPAKMLEVSVRTMEFCRQLGIAHKVRNWGFPLDYPLDNAFVTDMLGYEIGRIRVPSLSERSDSAFSPERGLMCPQTWFDPILQDCARSFPQIAIRHEVMLESFEQDPAGVTATLRDQR